MDRLLKIDVQEYSIRQEKSAGFGQSGPFGDSAALVGAAYARVMQDEYSELFVRGCHWTRFRRSVDGALDQKDMVLRRAIRKRKKGQPRTEVIIPIGISEGEMTVLATRSARIIRRAPESAERGMSFL